jgi:proteic killer suppression protein
VSASITDVKATFRDERLDKLEVDAGFDGGYASAIVKAYRRRMQQIRAAVDERDFYNQKSLRFEKLRGDRAHQYSMRLNDQWRLILEFEGKGPNKVIVIVGIEDYH